MSVHRSLARLAASLRLVEVAVSGAIAVSSFSVLSLLGGAAEGEARRSRDDRYVRNGGRDRMVSRCVSLICSSA